MYFQSEQKRFLQQHKLRSESYSKAAATIKKQRKKKTNVTKVGSAMDKEMKVEKVFYNNLYEYLSQAPLTCIEDIWY